MSAGPNPLDPNRAPCPKDCDGVTHTRCRGHNRSGRDASHAGQPCGTYPRSNQKVCGSHGGRAPQALAAAAKRGQAAAVESALRTFGRPAGPDEDAGELLLEEVRRSAGHVRWLAEVVAGLQQADLVWSERTAQHQAGHLVEGSVDVTTTTSAAAVNVWVEIYQRERKHLVDSCRVAIAAGLEERRVRLAEQSGEAHGMWLRAATASLRLGPEQLRQVMADGLANLHLVQGGAA